MMLLIGHICNIKQQYVHSNESVTTSQTNDKIASKTCLTLYKQGHGHFFIKSILTAKIILC